MKVATKNNTVLLQGEVESVDMTISKKGMVKVGRMLRDQIYTHKAWAVVREIIANAVDEHNKHGIARPVLVTLPTMEDANFRVRDFAKGLSKEKVFSVFFQYFESTKDESNDEIGGFGIGAKSPLAYADMFFVDSYHGGMKTSYVANVSGEASTAHKMALEDTNETGIEVSVPIQSRDFSQFNSLVGELLHFSGWNVQVTNGVKLQKPESNWAIENDIGKIGRTGSAFRSTSEIFACVKGIMYVVDSHAEIKNPFHQTTVLLFNGTDEIEIHPSRERIELSQRNIYKINTALEALKSKIAADINAQFSSVKTVRDKFKIKTAAEIFRNSGFLSSLGIVTPKTLDVKGRDFFFFEWSATTSERIASSAMMRGYSNYDVSFNPNGLHGSISSWQRKGKYKAGGSIVVFSPSETIRSESVIAYANKMGIASPIFCLKTAKTPEGWVEGSDFYAFDSSKITEDEVKAIRAIYSPRTPRGAKQAIVLPKGDETMGYASGRRSQYNRFTFNSLTGLQKTGKTFLLVEYGMTDDTSSADIIFDKKMVYVPKSMFPIWKKSGLPYEILTKDSFKAACKKYLEKSVVIPTIKGLRVDYQLERRIPKKYHRSQDECVIAHIKETFPDLVDALPKDKNGHWDLVADRMNALSDVQREALQLYVYGYSQGGYPAIEKLGKDSLEKVFA